MPPRLCFPPKRRLRKRRQFLAVQGQGRRFQGRYFLLFARARSDSANSAVAGGARFGITVTRKIGNAVIRNRVKRMVREGCRHSAELFPPRLDLVIVARQEAATARTGQVAAELLELARRASAWSVR